MAIFTRTAVAVLTTFFLVAQLSHSRASPNENKVMWRTTSAAIQKEKSHGSKGTDRLAALTLVDFPRTCTRNLSTSQLREEFIAYLRKQFIRELTRPIDDSKRTKTTTTVPGQLKRTLDLPNENAYGFKQRIVYPIADKKRDSVNFIVNAADANEKKVVIWLRASSGCPLRAAVKIGVVNGKNRNEICVHMMKNHQSRELILGKHSYQSKGWVSFDVTHLAKKVMESVGVVCKNIERATYLHLQMKTPKCFFGYHNTYSQSQRHTPQPIECTPGEKRCCRQATTLSFHELWVNLPFLVIPSRFRNGYCRGSCSDEGGDSHCCVPTKTTGLAILSYRYGLFRKHILPDFAVISCGCR